jgi:hypothetical protein
MNVNKEKLTQCDKILRHLKDYGTIDPMTALSEYGIMRLASRVSDLKKRGLFITREIKKGLNRYGEVVRYAEYKLISGGINGENIYI